MNANIFAKANQIIKSCDLAYFAVLDQRGYPTVSAVCPLKWESLFVIQWTKYLQALYEKLKGRFVPYDRK